MKNNFNKILNLIKKTGDKVIVVPDFGEPYVLLSFGQYEQMINNQTDYRTMSESDILNKVNRDIALWKQAQREIGFDEEVDFFSSSDLQEKLPLNDSSNFKEEALDLSRDNFKKVTLDNGNDLAGDKIDSFPSSGIRYENEDYKAENFDEWDFEEDNWNDKDKDIETNRKYEENEIDNGFNFDEFENFKFKDEKKIMPEKKGRQKTGAEKIKPKPKEESIKYENIPPPPPIASVFEEEKPIIDVSFDDEYFNNSQISSVDSDKGDDGFLIEPIG